MNVDELKPNSHKYNLEKSEAPKEVVKVTKGKVVTKKRSARKKFADIFLAEDMGNVKDYLVSDVIIPTIKDGLADMLQKGIEMLFYGRASSGKRKPGATYVSYNSYSKSSSDRARTRTRSLYSYDDIILETRAEAEDVMDMLNEILDKYKQVTVADLYDAVGVTGNGYTDNQYGWLDLRDVRISKCREGYLLDMPRCIDLD